MRSPFVVAEKRTREKGKYSAANLPGPAQFLGEALDSGIS
jgi:hypothetical protein